MGQKTKSMKKKMFFYEKNMRCGVWDEVVEQKGTLPPSKSSIGSKESAKKMKTYVYLCFLIFSLFKLIN